MKRARDTLQKESLARQEEEQLRAQLEAHVRSDAVAKERKDKNDAKVKAMQRAMSKWDEKGFVTAAGCDVVPPADTQLGTLHFSLLFPSPPSLVDFPQPFL
jgi:hypothetical protein